MKSATVLALDVSCHSSPARALARQVCMETILRSLLYCPSGEVGVVLAGTEASANALHLGDSTRFRHVTTLHDVAKASVEMARAVSAVDVSLRQTGSCDVLETLAVCADVLLARTGGKKYTRHIQLLTDAKDEVADKSQLPALVETLQASGVTLTVVGIDFSESAASIDEDWQHLSTKQENERVLHYLCGQLAEGDGESGVVSLAVAAERVRGLRRRAILQRATARLVLAIGDVHIATEVWTRTAAETVPALQRMAVDGAAVAQHVRYAPVEEGELPSGPSLISGEPTMLSFLYGRGLIACDDADVAAMRLRGPRGLWGLGFAARAEIPPYVLAGPAKTLLPLAADLPGQRAFACLAEAMLQHDVVLLARYVARRDGPPALGVCAPLYTAETDQYTLTYVPLPFMEDVRHYRFPEHDEVSCTAAEEASMEALVSAMTVGPATLSPDSTVNPELHQYYCTVQAKLHQLVCLDEARTGEAPVPVPPLLPSLERTATAFHSPANALAPLFASVAAELASVAAQFPYTEVDPRAEADRVGYLLPLATAPPATGGKGSSHRSSPAPLSSTAEAPSTIAAGVATVSGVGAPSSSPSTVAAAVEGWAGPIQSLDPVGSFHRALEACKGHPRGEEEAMEGLAEVALDLLRTSVKDALYVKCDACVRALREHCVRERRPGYYHAFLRRLRATAEGLGSETVYWQAHVSRAGSGLHPISSAECPGCDAAGEVEVVKGSVSDCAPPPPLDFSDDGEDPLMEMIV